ncbi:hypothetical protein [Streptosporangium sp. NPDC087985]|uniref:hypothetical protein n=1 Tax=Streptosporangium sp. NPDC087985 TaxID=3366196 RepID=UPI0037FB30E1
MTPAPLVALFKADDNDHKRCLDFLERHPGPVLTEVCRLVESRAGPEVEAQFLQSIIDGVLALEAIISADIA